MNDQQNIPQLSAAELTAALAGGQVLLIDVLPQNRYQQIHIPGALQACVFEVTFLNQVADLATGIKQPIVVYGADGQTHDALTAADKLLRAGYQQVSVLTGGLKAWQDAGYSLEGDAADATESRPATIADGRYPVDTENSAIEWAGRNLNSTHVGTLKLSSGEVQVENGIISGNFTIDMNSISNTDLAGSDLQPVLEDHLRSDDFFFTSKFPEASFQMSAEPIDGGGFSSAANYRVSGQLSLCGVRAEQSFAANIFANDEGRLIAEAHFDFDRTRWGVIYGSTRFFKHLGMHILFDEISLQLRLKTK